MNEEILTEEDIDLIKFLVEKGIDINHSNEGTSILSTLAKKPARAKTVKLLLKLGADPNVTDSWGIPILDYAAGDPDLEKTLKYLLKYGAKPNMRDSRGKTPLDFALQRAHELGGNIAVLEKYGAKKGSDL